MTKLNWDALPRDYEVGVDRGVFYPPTSPGEAWSGLISVQESPSEADGSTRYVDGVKYQRGRRSGEFAGTIEAFTFPESFYDDVLSQRRPRSFGLSYRTKIGDSYKIHLVYNILLTPSEQNHEYDELSTFSWGFTTRPITVPEAVPTSHIIIDVSTTYSTTLADLETAIYGSDEVQPRLPSPTEVMDIFEINSILRVIDHGDGTFTVTGPDDAVTLLPNDTFQIDWPSAVYIDENSYTIHSL